MAGSERAAAQYTGMHRNPVTQYVKLLTFNPLMGCTLFLLTGKVAGHEKWKRCEIGLPLRSRCKLVVEITRTD